MNSPSHEQSGAVSNEIGDVPVTRSSVGVARDKEQSIFVGLLECDTESERQRALQQACGDDHELRGRVEVLLKRFAAATSFMQSRAFEGSADTMRELFLQMMDDEAAGAPPSQMLLKCDTPPATTKLATEDGAAARQRYRLNAELARGGMGVVYEGRDQELGREVAVKVLRRSVSEKANFAERFLAEARISGQLQHPGIVPVYSTGQLDDSRPFFAMKLVRGDTLAQRLERLQGNEEKLAETIQIFEQVCQTVAYAHSRDVIHRDLKPSNIMVGAFGEVQVMDWGLAKVLVRGEGEAESGVGGLYHKEPPTQDLQAVDGDTDGSFDTDHGSVMGTSAYMPPEQATGSVPLVDQRSDVFSLGAILCEILTGQPPYVAERKKEVQRLASQGDLTDCLARLSASEAPDDLVQLAVQCMQPAIELRPADAGEVAQKLADYRLHTQQRLRQAELDSVAADTRAQEETRRHRLSRMVSGLLLTLLIGTVAVAITLSRSADQQRTLKQVAESHLVRSRASLASARSRALAEEDPVTAARWAAQAITYARESGKDMEVAQEAVMNVMGHLSDMGRPLRTDTSGVADLFFAGKYLFGYSSDAAKLQYWNYQSTGDLVAETRDFGDRAVKHYRISLDGRRAVTASDDTLYVWRLADDGPRLISETIATVSMLELSGDGNRLVTVEHDAVRYWDLDADRLDGQVVTSLANPVGHLSLSGEGRWLAFFEELSLAGASNQVHIYDLAADTPEMRPLTLPARPKMVFLDEDGRSLITVSDDEVECQIDTWSLSDLEKPVCTTTRDAFQAIRLSPDSRYLVGVQYRRELVRVPIEPGLDSSGEPPATVRGGVYCTSFSPDGRWTLCGTCTGWATLVDHETGTSTRRRNYSVGLVRSAIDASGRWMATSHRSGEIRLKGIYDPVVAGDAVAPGAIGDKLVWRGLGGPAYTEIAVSHTGRWLATIALSGQVRLIDVQGGERLLSGGSVDVIFSSDERWLITCNGASDQPIHVWDLQAEDIAASRRQMGTGFAALTPDSDQLVTGSTGQELLNWDLNDWERNEPVEIRTGCQSTLTSLAVDPSGKLLISCGRLMEAGPAGLVSAVVWEMNNPSAPGRVLHTGVANRRVEFALQGSMVATTIWQTHAEGPCVAAVWDLGQMTDRELPEPRLIVEPKEWIWKWKLTPDGKSLFTSRGGTASAQLYDLVKMDGVPSYLPTPGVQDVAISANGRWAAMCKRGPSVQFFDLRADNVQSSRRMLYFRDDTIWNIALSGDSRWLVTGSSDGTLRRLCLDIDWCLDYINRMTRHDDTPLALDWAVGQE